jgi:alanyl-tRNA synthetase
MSDHPMLSAQEIRQRFLAFFAARGHAVLPSASLLPENDPTVLFTTAGMQPLVPYLLGQPHPQGRRLVNIQKCIRTGDIDEVGDNRHLTFFEMLGNWSLNDYFKHESIPWSLEFLTNKEEGLGLDVHRLYVTVFAGDENAPLDTESIGIWQEAFRQHGIDAKMGERIFSLGREDNWWGPAGQTGPCGPDTEIFYDTLGEGAPVKDGQLDTETGRAVEIWNNVFMQYTKEASGEFVRTPHHNVDTGMGLERMTMILQGKATPYETDLFQPIMDELQKLEHMADHRSKYIIADHLRAAVMMIADGVVPSNKDRGYVLRRLLRRAILHLEQKSTEWVPAVVQAVASIYGEAYPTVNAAVHEIAQSITEEAVKFQRTLQKGKVEIEKHETLTGKVAFDLYQSYGFPLELTQEYAESRGIKINQEEFETEFRKHQELSRTASAGQFASGLADHSEQTVKYHTATHLLHQALRNVLGGHVQQRGSNITPERLRFDFSHPEKMTDGEISAVEVEVNAQIKAALPVSMQAMSPEQAKAEGAIGLFGHKYGESVTVYSMGTYSKEICTGPHVKNTSELGHFKITKEEAVSAGVRRIKAVLE